MAVGLESNHRRVMRLRVDPQDAHHHHTATHGPSQSRHWWHWRSHKKPSEEATTTATRAPVHDHHDHHRPGRYHSNDQFAPTRPALNKRLSSTLAAIHDDPPTVHGRRKRIVLHAIFKC